MVIPVPILIKRNVLLRSLLLLCLFLVVFGVAILGLLLYVDLRGILEDWSLGLLGDWLGDVVRVRVGLGLLHVDLTELYLLCVLLIDIVVCFFDQIIWTRVHCLEMRVAKCGLVNSKLSLVNRLVILMLIFHSFSFAFNSEYRFL